MRSVSNYSDSSDCYLRLKRAFSLPEPAEEGPAATETWRSPAGAGLLVSRPVSRILSCAAIYLCAPPGSRRAGSSILLGLAPDGVWRAAASPRRWCALTAPFHPCLYAPHVRARHRRSVSVPLSRGFPRVGVTDRPCPSVSGLSSRDTSRDCVACATNSTARIKLQLNSEPQLSQGAPAAIST